MIVSSTVRGWVASGSQGNGPRVSDAMTGGEGRVETAEWYRWFAEREVKGHSPAYESLARGVAADDRLLSLIDGLPPIKRQPNLLFAAARFLGGPVDDPAGFLSWTTRH